ncbi:MAG: glycosyltransferase family 39 protein [Candidatus Aenigmatarchaeota archaeon]
MRFLIVLLILSLPWLLFYNFNGAYYWDEAVYMDLARNIKNGEYFVNMAGDESFRAPFFPFILYILYPLGEHFLKVLPIIFMFSSVFVIYHFISRFYDKKTAFYLSSFLLTSPLLLFFGERLLTETIFLFLFSSSLLFFYISIEKDKRYMPLVGLLTGLSFLTKYQGIYLIPTFIIYIYIRKKLSVIKSKEFVLSAIIFILLMIPWLLISYTYYGNIFGSYKAQMDTITSPVSEAYYSGSVFFYIIYSVAIFGIPILLFPAFLNKKFFDKNFSKLAIISVIIIFMIFSFSMRKELRYLVAFSFIFLLPCALGLKNLESRVKKKKIIIPIIFSILILLNVSSSAILMINGRDSGLNIKNAAEFLKDRVSEDEYIVASNYPVMRYITNAKILAFPPSESQLINETYKIKYIVVDFAEVDMPEYAKRLDMMSYIKKIREFGSGWDRVIIYQP